MHIASNVLAQGPVLELGEDLEHTDPVCDLDHFLWSQLLMVRVLQHIRGLKKQDLACLRVKGVCHLRIVNGRTDVHNVESLVH